MNDEDKKKFLKFLTGADRVPILGLKSLNVTIQKVNDVNFLPVAHTWWELSSHKSSFSSTQPSKYMP